MTAPAVPLAEQYPIRNVRFVNGRTSHRTRRPDDERWWDLLHAACGKSGYLCRGYPNRPVRDCRGCERAVGGDGR